MLKWSFTFLLLANLAFFALLRWGGASSTEANNPPVPAALNAEKIVLLSAASAPSSASASVGVAPPSVAASAVKAPAPTVASQVAAVIAVSAPLPASAATPASQLSCLEWTAPSGATTQRAEKTIADWHWGDKVRQRSQDSASGYWVFIGPLHSRAEVEQKIIQLKARDVLDYFAITDAGRWQNAISLGVFKTEEAAKKHLLKLQGQGVKTAVIGEKGNKLKQSQFSFKGLNSEQAAKVSALHKDFPESELRSVACN